MDKQAKQIDKISDCKVSIITICYNNENVIRKTIESVITQRYLNIEYIVIDGNSKDDSLDIIREYGDKIAFLLSEPDKNLYDAINKGLKLATGDIIGLIHAGDRLFDAGVIEKIVNHFTCQDIDIMYGNSILVNNKDIPVRVNISPEYSRSLIRRGWMPSHQSIYLRRELLERSGYYNLNLHPNSDYEFFLRYFYFNNYRIKRLNEFILKFSIGGMSTKNYINNIKAQKSQIECWTINGENPPFYLIPFKLLRKPKQFFIAGIYRIKGLY